MISLADKGINNKIANNINDIINKSRIPHSILIYGGSSEQRKYLSQYLACSFVCSEDKKPCGLCINCQKALSDNHPDIKTTDPEQVGEKIFKIALVRDIRTDAYIIPNEAQNKVYILRSADKMNVQAQNALLKIIEEPPEYARFILECESIAPLLDTIISRVSLYNLGSDKDETLDELKEKSWEIASKLANALTKPTELEFMRITSVFEKDKDFFPHVLKPLQIIIRDAVAIKVSSNVFIGKDTDTSRELASKLTLNALMKMINDIDEFNECIAHNANKNLLITRFSSVLRSSAYGK